MAHPRFLEAGAALAGGLLAFGFGGGPLFALACAAIPAGAARAARRRRHLVAEALRSRSTTAACRALAAELRAGRAPAEAVRAVAIDAPDTLREPLRQLERLFAGQEIGLAGTEPAVRDVPAFAELAAAWRVCAVTGAGLAHAVTGIALARVAEEAQRQEIEAALASAQASAGVLAFLPLLGLLAASAAGAAPLGWLLRAPAGGAAFFAGVMLDLAGLAWVRALRNRALQAG
jgi:tight adherence protein B